MKNSYINKIGYVSSSLQLDHQGFGMLLAMLGEDRKK